MSTLLIAALAAAAPVSPVLPADNLAQYEVEKKRVCTESSGMGSRASVKKCTTRYYGADGKEISKEEAERRKAALEAARSQG